MPQIPLHIAVNKANTNSVIQLLSRMDPQNFYDKDGKLVRAMKGYHYEDSYTPLELALMRFRKTSRPKYLHIARLILQKDPAQKNLPYPKVIGATGFPSADKTFLKHSLKLLAQELNARLTDDERRDLERHHSSRIRELSRKHNRHGTHSAARNMPSVPAPSAQSSSSSFRPFSGKGLGLMRRPNTSLSSAPMSTNSMSFENTFQFLKRIQRKESDNERKRRRHDLANHENRGHAATTLVRLKKSHRH